MECIFPPSGEQNLARFQSVKKEEREYLLFSLEFCDQVLAKRPTHVEALELAANHFTELGYFDDGLRLDERLVALKPDDPGVLYNLACSLALTGRIDQALHILAQSVANGYNDYRHLTTDRDLNPLRGDPRFGEILAMAAKGGE